MSNIYFFISTLISIFSFALVKGDDVLGCNGFVKSDIDIDFSKVEVKLFTKQGSLKDHTECAPKSGYYFLPLYDKGEYILKVGPPSGWTFEPSEVALTVDGVSDPCSQGNDINFIFQGYAITGKIVSDGHIIGPKGVKLSLSNDEDSVMQETITMDQGIFIFTSIFPGHYTITASHPKWKFSKNKANVNVLDGNGVAVGLSVAGYDVTGSVTSDSEPIAGVRFILFTEMPLPINVGGCENGRLAEFSGVSAEGSPVCHVTSSQSGSFVFPQLPPGQYTLIPYYTATTTKFHVHPRVVKFILGHESLNLDTPFQVKGFTVSGRVLWSPDGKPMSGAIVKLNGKQVAKTGSDGVYLLESMKAGIYKLQVEANDVEFSGLEVKVSATTLGDVYPAKYRVSGALSPAAGGISLKVSGGEHIQTNDDGTYSILLPKGKYSISVVPNTDTKLQFSPQERNIQVIDSTVEDVNFSQLKCTVKGKIVCKTVCPLIKINLKPKTGGNILQTIAKGGEYEFNEVLPGDYDVFIGAGLEWCWEKESHSVPVNSQVTLVPTFVQSGRTVTIVSTHNTKVMYWSDDNKERGEVTVSRGRSHICVESTSPLNVQPLGCHTFKQNTIKWESGTIKLEPLSHTNTFYIDTTHPSEDLMVNVVMGEDGGPPTKVRPKLLSNKTPSGEERKFRYEVALNLKEGQKVTLVPTASLLLFTPFTAELKGDTDCRVIEEPLFTAEKGLILTGKVMTGDKKGLGDVTVRVVDEKEEIVSTQQTVGDGTYRFPPIRMSQNYRLIAEKEGYVLTRLSGGDLSAHKLAEITVIVTDVGRPLQGVLLSLSGGDNYRRNAQTNTSGTMSFISLTPGEYFLRAMMKEYSFKPGGKMITVTEGATIKVELSGKRVAWSGHGRVVSLNGEGESGVTIEAVGQTNCSLLQEEATSGPTGVFRIRGLQPDCEYKVRVKEGPEINTHIQKSTPDSIPVMVKDSDISGLVLYALRGISRTDIVVYVRFSDEEELRGGSRLKLAREDSPDSPLVTVKLADYAPRSVNYRLSKGVVIALGGVPADGKNYVVSANGRAVTLKADAPLRLARITLTPSSAQQPLHPDLSRPVYPPILPLALLGAVIYYYRKKLMPLLPDLHLGPVMTSEDSEDNNVNRAKRSKSRKT